MWHYLRLKQSFMFDIPLFFHYSVIQISQSGKLFAVSFTCLVSVYVHKDFWNVNKFCSTLPMDQDMCLPESRKVLHENIGIAVETPKFQSREEQPVFLFHKRKLLFFQNCNILRDPSTDLLC